LVRTLVPNTCLVIATLWLASPAIAATPPVKAVASAPDILQLQVLLDRLGFTPGTIDGKTGISLKRALRGFQEAHDLPQSGALDAATKAVLADIAAVPGVIEVTLGAEDFAGPFVGPIPKAAADQARLPAMGYADAKEALAERFHTTPAFLAQLNGATALESGARIKVPNVVPAASAYPDKLRPEWKATLASLNVASDQPQAARLVVDKSDGMLRAYDAAGKLVASFPATMGSSHDPLPIGHWKIQGTSYLPTYHYNPALFWDAKPGDAKQTLKAGPNSPVGVVWIDLDKPHYGIHGTPEPQNIGHTESHGCIRLTNWDAARLALMVKPGTPAEFQP
jgi:lipoprotein-anchoring transpeptidase ErfK/SrfK